MSEGLGVEKITRRIRRDVEDYVARVHAILDAWDWKREHIRPATAAELNQRPRSMFDGGVARPAVGMTGIQLGPRTRDGREP